MKETEILVAGSVGGYGQDILNNAFGHVVANRPKPGSADAYLSRKSLVHNEMVIVEEVSTKGMQIVTMTSFDCPSPDRKTWKIRIHRAQGNANSNRPSPIQNLTFEQ